jgi:hypothetical protein
MTVNEQYRLRIGDEVIFRYGRERVRTGVIAEIMTWGVLFAREYQQDGSSIMFNACWSDIISVNGQPVSAPDNTNK